MSIKSPSTKASRVPGAVSVISGAVMLYGIWLIHQGRALSSSTVGQNLPEDNPHAFDGLSGGIEQLYGVAITVIAGLIFLTFVVAYLVNKKGLKKN